jgi:hypothetical protein
LARRIDTEHVIGQGKSLAADLLGSLRKFADVAGSPM